MEVVTCFLFRLSELFHFLGLVIFSYGFYSLVPEPFLLWMLHMSASQNMSFVSLWFYHEYFGI
jgi:hypothetical protein